MLLYQDSQRRYLAVPSSLRFSEANGYSLCFNGRDVPEVICRAFIRESGGRMLASSGEELELSGVDAFRFGTDTRARQLPACA